MEFLRANRAAILEELLGTTVLNIPEDLEIWLGASLSWELEESKPVSRTVPLDKEEKKAKKEKPRRIFSRGSRGG